MRKMLVMVLATLALTAGAANAQTATKIAFVNSQKILAEAPGAAEVRTTIQREMEKHRADLGLADDSLKNLIANYEKRSLVLSADARQKEEQTIRQRQQALAQRAEQLEDQMVRRQQELAKPIMDRINDVLQAIRKEGNYTLILDAASGGIVAADNAADLTDTVLARLKTQAAKP